MRAAAKKHGDTKGIHASSEQQQHKHGTAQASEQGAERGGGVLTLLPIDVTDAGMAMLVRPLCRNAHHPMVSRLLLAANSTLVNFEHPTKACDDVQFRQGRCERQQQRQWDKSSSQQQQQQEQQQWPVTK